MKKIKAIIFDMDGVLIDAREWHFLALNKSLKIFGLEISKYDHLVTYDGLPTKKKLDMLTLDGRLPKGLHSLVAELKQRHTVSYALENLAPNFVHKYALSRLKNDGYLTAVCSNSIRSTVELFLSRAGLVDYIDFYLSNEDVDYPKPNSQMYDFAIKRFGISPSECLIFEDNENGIKAARDSGANVYEVKDISDINHENLMAVIKRLELGL